MSHVARALSVAVALWLTAPSAGAQEEPIVEAVAPPVVAPPPPKISGARILVGFLGSGLVGGAVGYGTIAATCGGEICVGGAVAGMVLDIAVTPLTAWGIGRAMGGEGSLKSTYVGGLLPFALSASVSATDPGVGLGVGMALMPLGSALVFELSSRAKALGPVEVVRIEPLPEGARLRVAGTF